jgi:hypothetical protein
MKNLSLNSTEQSIINIIEIVGDYKLKTIRTKNKEEKIQLSRAILGVVLYENKTTIKRIGSIINRHHATVLHYIGNHKDNLKYYPEYNVLYDEVKEEYRTGYKRAKVDIMEKQIKELQDSIKTLKVNLNY